MTWSFKKDPLLRSHFQGPNILELTLNVCFPFPFLFLSVSSSLFFPVPSFFFFFCPFPFPFLSFFLLFTSLFFPFPLLFHSFSFFSLPLPFLFFQPLAQVSHRCEHLTESTLMKYDYWPNQLLNSKWGIAIWKVLTSFFLHFLKTTVRPIHILVLASFDGCSFRF